MRQSSEGAPRRGRQEPSFSVVPRYAYTDGADCAELVAAYGMPPDAWQRAVLDGWLARDSRDRLVSGRCGLSVPRQNGKNAVIEMRELYGMVACGERILHTAHEVKTARKAFIRLCGFFENERKYPELAALVKCIRKTNGQEAIELQRKKPDGTFDDWGSVEFSARSEGAARGFTVDTIVLDEAQELTDEQLETIMSTAAAAPTGDRQLILTGTPPYPGCAGEVFARTHREAHSDPAEDLCWHEWSVSSIGNLDDTERWYETNPALGIRLDMDYTARERKTMTDAGFARERLGWWAPAGAVKSLVDAEDWAKCATSDPPMGGAVTYGCKLSVDGSVGSICACVREEGRKPYVEWIATETLAKGVQWFAEWLEERSDDCDGIAVDGGGLADNLASALSRSGIGKRKLVKPCSRDMAAACGMLADLAKTGGIEHFGQPRLDASVTKTAMRRIGSVGYGFETTERADATAAEAAAIALWASEKTSRSKRETGLIF